MNTTRPYDANTTRPLDETYDAPSLIEPDNLLDTFDQRYNQNANQQVADHPYKDQLSGTLSF